MCLPAIELKCRFCSFTSSSLKGYLSHRTIHRHININFPCGVDNCQCIFHSETSLRSHLVRQHGIRCRQGTLYLSAAARDGMFTCSLQICKAKLYTRKDLCKHMRMHLLSGRAVRCPFPGCSETYRSVGSFGVHVSRNHPGKEGTVPVSVPFDPMNLVEAEMLSEIVMPSESNDTIEPIFYDEKTYLNCLATFFMKLEFQFLIPAKTVQYIATEFRMLHEQSLSDICQKIKSRLHQENIIINNLDSVLSDSFTSQRKNLHTLRSTHTRAQFSKKNFIFVEPKKKGLEKPKTFFYYVPIAETLKAAFLDKSVNISLDPPVQSDPNILEDFTDGVVFKQNKFFLENPRSIRLIFYQDGFTLCSGYGKNKHKITGVYMSIGNLPAFLRTHVDSILLVALYRDKDFDHKLIYGPIVKDLKVLERDGLFIPEYGTLKVGIAFIAGDNLGSHALGGFTENFSRSIYFCRYCLIDRKSFHSNHHEQFPMRTPESYRCSLNGSTVHTKKGVKLDSEFNKLLHFHVCNPGLPACLGHDLFEGIVSHDLALFVHYFVSEGWFELEELNTKLDKFPYTDADRKDRPYTVQDKCEKLSGGAMQIWNFLRLFPLLVMSFVQDWTEKADDEVWQALLLLSEIVELVMAPKMHTSVLAYLDTIIHNYLDLRKRLFPDKKLRPKHHYLTHYCFLIVCFGPLNKVWGLRYESKHQFFKRFARVVKNFTNICKSLSFKHELFMCYLRTGANLRCVIKPNLSGEFHQNMYSLDIQTALPEYLPSLMQECASIVIKGTMYKKGSVLFVQQTHYQCEEVFGRILLILYDNNASVHFLVEVLEAEFVPYLRVYKLGAGKMYKCVEHSSLLSYCIVPVYKIGSLTYVRLRSNVFYCNVQS